MGKIFAGAVLGLALASGLASAHGPTRQKVTETVEIGTPADKVWAAIGNFDDMSWHPAVTKTDGRSANAVDGKRQLTLAGGGTIDEVLAKYDAARKTYSYRIEKVDVSVLPVTNYSSTLTVKPLDAQRSQVEWRGAFYRGFPNNDPPPELSDEAAVKAVSGVYRAGLDNLKKTLESGS